MTRKDFFWETTDEPHAARRKLILEKYPKIKELYGYDSKTKWKVLVVCFLQILSCYLISQLSWFAIILIAWSWGGTLAQFLNLAIHEISHGLAFEKETHNRLFSIFITNLPLGIPASVTFKRYHMEHHSFQGEATIDMDLPCKFEGIIFKGKFLKLIWVFLQPLFYILRPIILAPKNPTIWEGVNWISQISFNFLIYYLFGVKAIAYLPLSTLLGMGLHPIAGHFIAEHYVFNPGFETYSYYGPLNYITCNVGYHNEHHDFPRIPGSRLYKLRQIAPEFYDHLPQYDSWVKVIWNYIFDDNMGPYYRTKRLLKNKQIANNHKIN
eukprot:TRINITY_DN276_c0_g1_i4.p1 TRINITY_DN276_c0_g1~~TRINITY_DN276_c0_g1_i4.p1  ORF type:complete len:324 (-),score=110.83 TRINITY_DN276_c0_g1_i4:74-1045(-)